VGGNTTRRGLRNLRRTAATACRGVLVVALGIFGITAGFAVATVILPKIHIYDSRPSDDGGRKTGWPP
jgi:hypothetical protein